VVINGGSRRDAAAIAGQVFQRDAVTRSGLNPACQAAEAAYRAADKAGRDAVLEAALAFMEASPSDSPCAASAKDYITAINNGAEHIDAGLVAAKAFAAQIVSLAKQGKNTIDPACARASLAYASSSDQPSAPATAAMRAFINKALETGSSFDPVCLSSAEQFWTSYAAGKDETSNRVAAARSYISTYSSNPSVARSSPCAAAAKAYASALVNDPSNPTNAALVAFIDNAIISGDNGVDPVCTASAEAYLDSFLAGADDATAREAAAVAYIAAVEANPNFDPKSPCGRAADAYIATF